MNAKEVAKITGVSVRALHHYDTISILSPSRNPKNGYREYSDEDMDRLQQILFFKECGFSLVQIKELLSNPNFDREKAFNLQKNFLLQEKKRIELMLETLDKSVRNMKGNMTMSIKEKFHGFDFTNNPYENEARRLWGDKAVDQSNARIKSLPKNEQEAIAKDMDDLFMNLAKIRNNAPDSVTAQEAMAKMYNHFNANFGYRYSPEAFAEVGQMYVTDERFTVTVDKYGDGLSKFLSEAMKIYAESLK
ncbi:MAG: MerR family transcriptional regulator [Lachnospiraceae bacterium]